MNKTEFLAKRDVLSEKIDRLNEEMSNLKREYKESNQQFPIGTKVKVSFGTENGWNASEHIGIIVGYEIHNATNDVIPILAKVKKDGTAHPTAHLYISWYRKHTIEVCE